MEKGETVQLVTGKGPIMTINEVGTEIKNIGRGKGNILCKWWDEKERDFKEYYFMAHEIVIYKRGPAARVGGHKTI